jgi:hypothetical protein
MHVILGLADSLREMRNKKGQEMMMTMRMKMTTQNGLGMLRKLVILKTLSPLKRT